MEALNQKFDSILATKWMEVQEQAAIINSKRATKNEKLTDTKDDLSYNLKTTIYKINAEQEKKLKNSKAYKNKEMLYAT